MPGFFVVTLGGLLGSSLAAAVLGLFFLRRNKRIEAEVKTNFDQNFSIFESKRSWKQQALSELLGPVIMQRPPHPPAFDGRCTSIDRTL
jgi:hypothetical protein